MGIQHGHTAWAYSNDMQHGHAASKRLRNFAYVTNMKLSELKRYENDISEHIEKDTYDIRCEATINK